MKLLADGVERLLAVGDDLEAIQHVFQEKLGEMGLTHFLYAEMPCPVPALNAAIAPFVLSRPACLLERYLAAVPPARDPIILELHRQTTPFTVVHAVENHIPQDDRAGLLKELEKAGLAHGLVVPAGVVQGQYCASTVFTSERGRRAATILGRARHRVHVLAAYFHQRVRQIMERRSPSRQKLLTPRERECLLWAASGKTAWETSRILKIAERTVKFHLANANRRLDTANTTHAVARAILRGEFLP